MSTTIDNPRAQLVSVIGSAVHQLQSSHLAGAPHSGAALARLRRAVTSVPGSDPDAWQHTIGILPVGLLGRTDLPSPSELAAHNAMTLYAIHQQGRAEPMHDGSGRTVGHAAASLKRHVERTGSGSTDAVQRRFMTLATAQGPAEVAHHLRSLVTQLRSAAIALDYGRLAGDLFYLQDPRREAGVRLAWGRDLYRHTSTPEDPAPSTTTAGEPS